MADAPLFSPDVRVHIIGIGGTGMSAIAHILLQRGYRVSGSDRSSSDFVRDLQSAGATVQIGHDAQHIEAADVVIATSAAPDTHVEIVAAKQRGLPVYRRHDVMQTLMHGKRGIAIAGTHGKTTTTSMTAHVLLATGQEPSYLVGAVLANTGANAAFGTGDAFVIEADEYGDMFLGLRPQCAILTSLEYDHPDFFESPAAMRTKFAQFVGLLPEDGLLIACADDAGAAQLAHARAATDRPVQTYGLEATADWQAVNIRYDSQKTLFALQHSGAIVAQIALAVPGKHNILNALAALIAAQHEGVDVQAAADALASFRGAARRFELRADLHGIAIVDDYAHHPTAIATTIEAARTRYPDREVWAIWQPHTYSRTRALWDAFLAAFNQAQHVIVTAIYASREAHDPSLSIPQFVDALRHPDAHYAPTFAEAVALLSAQVRPPAVVLIMSAGDAPHIGIDYTNALKAKLV